MTRAPDPSSQGASGLREAAAPLFDLIDELCDAVDAEAGDIGGSRGSLTILREIGPALAVARAAFARTGETEPQRSLDAGGANQISGANVEDDEVRS